MQRSCEPGALYLKQDEKKGRKTFTVPTPKEQTVWFESEIKPLVDAYKAYLRAKTQSETMEETDITTDKQGRIRTTHSFKSAFELDAMLQAERARVIELEKKLETK